MTVDVVTSAESLVAQRRVAGALRRRGLRPGDRLALVLPGSPGYLAVVLGALRSGMVPVPLDPGLTAYEREPLLAAVEPALTVTTSAELAGLLDGPPSDLAPVPLARPMHATSGTTGAPKAVWSGLLDEAAAELLVGEERELWELGRDDRHLVCSPLHHSAPLRFATGTLLAGGTVLLAGRFSAERFASAVAEARPTSTFCVPAHLQRLLAYAGSGVGLPSLRGLRLLAHAGAPCPPAVKARIHELVGEEHVVEFYGSTEGQLTACRGREWAARPGTVGRARPGRTLSVDPDGMVWCAVPPYARFSYWRDPARTADAWRATPDGPAFTVRDLGRLDDEGYLWLDGRREDLVISGGVNVHPAEVEAVLGGCPGVEDVAVFGVPDERWGQRVCAVVVGPVGEDALRSWAAERLAPAKRPKDVHRLAELPRTPTGKVRRLDLPAALGLSRR